MDQSPPPLQHRQKRWTLWAGLWLARVVRLLSAFSHVPMPDAWRVWFDRALALLTKAVVGLVLIRAAHFKAPGERMRNPRQVARAYARHDVRVRDRTCMRAAIGGRLRRAVKARGFQAADFQARAGKLLHVLNSLDAFAARIARRARNGLTRILELHTGVESPLLICRAEALCAKAGPSRALSGAALRAADTS